jgi:hypothetical protein
MPSWSDRFGHVVIDRNRSCETASAPAAREKLG